MAVLMAAANPALTQAGSAAEPAVPSAPAVKEPGPDLHPESPRRTLPGPPHLRNARADQGLVDAGLRPRGMGTGFFVAHQGRLVTNNHVVKDCLAFTVETTTGSVALASLIAAEEPIDLALLKAELEPTALAAFRERIVLDNKPIAVIGYPVLGVTRERPLLVDGHLSGPWFSGNRGFAFEAELRPGNSGGPLLDHTGAVLGVVFARNEPVLIFQHTGRKVDKLGFAIANETVFGFLERHGVSHETASGSRTELASNDALFDLSSKFLVRVLCWRHK